MSRIEYIIVHCSDSEWGNADAIRDWHKQRGWRDIGYHFVILNGRSTCRSHYNKELDGTVEIGRALDDNDELDQNEIGAHALGMNHNSIGVCLVGKRIFSQNQFEALHRLCANLCVKHGVPVSHILGHCETDSGKHQGKTCPNFDVQAVRNAVARAINA